MNENEDLGKNINKLLALLKQMMSQEGAQPSQSASAKGSIPPELSQILKNNKNVQLNLCVFAFVPMSMDDMDDLEGIYEETMSLDDDSISEKDSLNMEINAHDIEFMRRNGIKF